MRRSVRTLVAAAATSCVMVALTATPAGAWVLTHVGGGTMVPVQNLAGPGEFTITDLAKGTVISCADTEVKGNAYVGSANPAISFNFKRFGGYLGNPNRCKTTYSGAPALGVAVDFPGNLDFRITGLFIGGASGHFSTSHMSGLRITLNFNDGCVATIGGISTQAGAHPARFTNATDRVGFVAPPAGNLVVKTLNLACDPTMIDIADGIEIDGGWQLDKDLNIA